MTRLPTPPLVRYALATLDQGGLYAAVKHTTASRTVISCSLHIELADTTPPANLVKPHKREESFILPVSSLSKVDYCVKDLVNVFSMIVIKS